MNNVDIVIMIFAASVLFIILTYVGINGGGR
jgi:hypothetical protein